MAKNKSDFSGGIYDEVFNSFVYDCVPEGKICLDVGCAGGLLGMNLIQSKKNIVDGIDNYLPSLIKAKNRGYRNTYKMDLNNLRENSNKLKNMYDVIILADVLEHLIDPAKTLKALKHFLKKDGVFVISLPNIGFILYRLKHLIGRWDYESGGVMDKTHLRFFTLKTAREIVEQNLFISRCTPYNQVKGKFIFLRYLGSLFPSIFALQFLIIAQKQKDSSKLPHFK